MTTTNMNDSCSKILNNIRNSALNYSCQETPYSIYVTIRKSWSKQNHQAFHVPVRHVQQVDQDLKAAKINSLNQELIVVKADLETANKMNDELKVKIDAAVIEADRPNKETEIENQVLKSAIKTSTLEKEKLNDEVKNLKKVLKSREKEINKLETFKNKNQEALKNAMSDGKELKAEKERLLKKTKLLENKIGELQKNKYSLEKNNNSLHGFASELTSEYNMSVSTTNPVVSTPTPSLDVSSVANASPSSSVISFAESDLASASSIASSTVLTISKTTQSLNTSSPSPTSPDNPCEHRPQCVIRQPKSPPADKCSILVHHGSKYHEHFLTSVPARYGPHDNCMAVSYENYGCSDCIWFKKWGELHGYPDLWPLKYIESGTYRDHF